MEKETEKKGREAKKKGKICGFDAGISPWGMAGWLTPAGTGIRSAFSVFATFPKTPFRAIPPPTVQDKLGVRSDGSSREAGINAENEKWMEAEKVV